MKSPVIMFLEAMLADAMRVPEEEAGTQCRAYTISLGGSDYMHRFMVPHVGTRRLFLHNILRPDRDRHLHNHPWNRSYSIVLHGGYVEERLLLAHGSCTCDARGHMEPCTAHEGTLIRKLVPGDQNELSRNDFHRIVEVQPDTWTLFLHDERVGEWGYHVDSKFVLRDDYYKMMGYPNHIKSG